MTEMSHAIDLELPKKLRDPEYRQAFFWAETGAEIAHGLVSLRKRRNMSQKDVAKATGTQQPAISRAEKADYDNWNLRTLRSIADALGARIRIIIQPYEDVLSEYETENADETNAIDRSAGSKFDVSSTLHRSAVRGYVISDNGEGGTVRWQLANNVELTSPSTGAPPISLEMDIFHDSQSSLNSLQSQNDLGLIGYVKVAQPKPLPSELMLHR